MPGIIAPVILTDCRRHSLLHPRPGKIRNRSGADSGGSSTLAQLTKLVRLFAQLTYSTPGVRHPLCKCLNAPAGQEQPAPTAIDQH